MVIPRNDCWRQARVWFFLHAENLALKEDHIYDGWLEPDVAFPFLPNESTNPPSQTPIYQISTASEQKLLDHFHLQQSGGPTSFVHCDCVHCDFPFGAWDTSGHWWDCLILHFVSGQCAWMQICYRYPQLISRWMDEPITLYEISQCSGFEQAWAKIMERSCFQSEKAKEEAQRLVKTMFPEKRGFTFVRENFESFELSVFRHTSLDDRWKAFCEGVVFDDDESKEKCRVYFDKMTRKQ